MKPIAEFSKNKRYQDGHASWCKQCHSAYAIARYQPKPPRVKMSEEERREHRRAYHRKAGARFYAKHRDRIRANARERQHRLRLEAKAAYAALIASTTGDGTFTEYGAGI